MRNPSQIGTLSQPVLDGWGISNSAVYLTRFREIAGLTAELTDQLSDTGFDVMNRARVAGESKSYEEGLGSGRRR